jgi:hypothetical protein
VPYATIAQVKAQLGIPLADTGRDAQLTAVLDAVEESIDQATDRSFTAATGTATAQVYHPSMVATTDEGDLLMTADIGSATGLAVAVGANGTFTTVTDSLELQPLGTLTDGWPATSILRLGGRYSTSPGIRIRVTADWGWPAVPSVVTQAVLIQAARIFKRKDSPEGIIGSAEWGTVRLSRVDPDVESMLSPYRRYVALVG